MSKKEVAKKEEESGAVSLMDQVSQDAGAGMENVGQQDVRIPFLKILQSQSKQTKKRESSYVAGAEEGMFFNSANSALIDGEKGAIVQFCEFDTKYIEWDGDETNGTIVQIWNDDSFKNDKRYSRDQKTGRYSTEDGTVVKEYKEFYIRIVGRVEELDDNGQPKKWEDMEDFAVLSLSGTQAKKAKDINTDLTNFRIETPGGKRVNPASWLSLFHITTVPEKNDSGSWFGIRARRFGTLLDVNGKKFPEAETHYQAGHDLYKAVSEGRARSEDHDGGDGANAVLRGDARGLVRVELERAQRLHQ